MDKSFLFGCGGRAILLVSIFPSNHRGKVLIMARRFVKDSRKLLIAGQNGAGALKAPEITQTYPPGQSEDHEKYSQPASAAIKSS